MDNALQFKLPQTTKTTTHRARDEGLEEPGWEEGECKRGGGLIFIIFQLIFVEGVSASWINKRAAAAAAAEWRRQCDNLADKGGGGGGPREIAARRSGTILIIFRKYLSSNNYFKPVCSQCA